MIAMMQSNRGQVLVACHPAAQGHVDLTEGEIDATVPYWIME